MMDDRRPQHEEHDDAEDLLRRALIDADRSAAVALKVEGLALAQALTVVFHGRSDLGTVQTYVANGGHGAGTALGAADLLRVPCDLDLGEAGSLPEAAEPYPDPGAGARGAARRGGARGGGGGGGATPMPRRRPRGGGGGGAAGGDRRGRGPRRPQR